MDGKPKEQPRIQLQGLEQLQVQQYLAVRELQRRLKAQRAHIGPGRKTLHTFHKNLPSRMFNPPYQEAGEPTRQQVRYQARCIAKATASKLKAETRRVKRNNRRSKHKKESVH